MREVSSRNFGLLISYLIPGFVALWGVSFHSPLVKDWLVADQASSVTIAGLLYVTICSLGLGLIASALRWVLVETIHQATGLRRPAWDDVGLPERLEAYRMIVQQHYHYYEFYGNSLIAIGFSYLLWRTSEHAAGWGPGSVDAVVCAVFVLLFFASRSSLSRYYSRTARLFSCPEQEINHDQRRINPREQVNHQSDANSEQDNL